MKRLLAIMLVGLLGLTINPLDWESKFNEQQDQITALETENEQLRSELDNMANYLMSSEDKTKLQGLPVVYVSQAGSDLNITTESIVTLLELELPAGTYQIDLFVRMQMDKRAGAYLNIVTNGVGISERGVLPAKITLTDINSGADDYINIIDWHYDLKTSGSVSIVNDGGTSLMRALDWQASGIVVFSETLKIIIKSALYSEYNEDTNVFLSDYSFIKATKLD